jgi:sulfate adenylyltransferase subunit 1 (EFTu-like GTPase family)
MGYRTKLQVTEDFKEQVYPQLKAAYGVMLDSKIIVKAWGLYLGSLAGDNLISEHQRDTWLFPTEILE